MIDETTSAPDGPLAGSSADEVTSPDFAKLNADILAAASVEIVPAPVGAQADVLHELAEDMIDIVRRLRMIEDSVTRLSARVDQVDARVYETGQSLSAELASQRRDLLGERKGILTRGLFNAVIGHVDALRAMRLALHDAKGRVEKANQRTVNQLEAIETTLLTALQGMGFREFRAQVGEAFSPASMECLGYAKGPPGIVLKAVRTGFASPEGVARAAGVVIADVSTSSSGSDR